MAATSHPPHFTSTEMLSRWGRCWLMLALAAYTLSSCSLLTLVASQGTPATPAATTATKATPAATTKATPAATTKATPAATTIATPAATTKATPAATTKATPAVTATTKATPAVTATPNVTTPERATANITVVEDVTNEPPEVFFKITIEPENPELGGDVTLTPRINLEGVTTCTWSRGDEMKMTPIVKFKLKDQSSEYAGAYTGRESVNAKCALHIVTLIAADSGLYKLETAGSRGQETGKAVLRISDEKLKPKKVGTISGGMVGGIVAGVIVSVLVALGFVGYRMARKSSMETAPVPEAIPVPETVPEARASISEGPKKKPAKGGPAQRGRRASTRGGGAARGRGKK